MNQYIAYCGLNCEACEARLATIHHDDVLREKVVKLWSELNGVEITPEMIHCEDCRIDGVKTPYSRMKQNAAYTLAGFLLIASANPIPSRISHKANFSFVEA